MIFSEVSIKRPVLATMMNLALVVFGLVALPRLPVRELPDVDPPIVNVMTVYPGASAEVVETEVTERLEEVINSVEGIKNLTSESREQLSSITVEFDLSRPIEVAAQDVRDRVARVRGQLPDDIEEPIVAKQDADAQPVIWIALFSDRYSTLELTTLAENRIKDRLQTVKGVSSIFLGGRKRYAMRLRLDAEKMAAHQVTIQDVENALRTQNIELPSGRVESMDRELTIQTRGELKTADEFNDLVILRSGGAFVRLRDVGRAETGVEDERSIARYNSKPAVGLGIVKQSKANTIEVAKGVKAEMARIQPSLPAGVEVYFPYDESIFVEDSIHEVWITLGIAFLLVIVTIFIFLRNIRSTIIPVLTIPVSIIGTFMVLLVMGYSVNILTMLALVLAIGIVVDDSIVVLENIYRHMEEGLSPMDAALKGMREIGFAVIAVTLSLVAVFIPLAFQSTITGRLLVEFALALCGSVIISAFVALSLTPMAAARVLKPVADVRHGSLFQKFEHFFERWAARYDRALAWALRHRGIVVALAVAVVGLAAVLFSRLESEYLPEEDKGRLLALALAPEGATSEYTDRMVQRMEGIARETPEIEGYFSAVALARGGPGKGNEGLMFMRFKDERDRSVQDVVGGPRGLGARFFGEIEGAFAFPIIPKAIGFSFGQPFQLVVQNQDLEQLNRETQAIANRLRQSGYLMNVRSTYELNKPELRVSVDRNRAAALGVSVQSISRTLQVLFGGLDISRIKVSGKEYQVIAQLERPSRLSPSDLDRLYVRGDGGQLVQLSNVVTYEPGAGPNAIPHFNRFRAATIEGTPVGMPLGTAMQKTRALLREEFPNVRTEWTGESEDLQDAGTSFLFVLIFSAVIVYMVLASQFESLLHPITIMITLPLAAVGAFGALWLLAGVNAVGTTLYGWAHYAPDPPRIAHILSSLVPRIPSMSINLFSQVGMVLLVGLVTKNSILLVEFANQRREQGLSAIQAMIEAGRIRFRPIMMTSFSTILGILPIAIGFGAGGESRRPMGVAAVGGLLSSTFLTLIVIPVVYTLFSDLGDRFRRRSLGAARKAGAAVALFVLLGAASPARAQEPYDLNRCIQRALAENFDIQQARERIRQESGAVLEVRASSVPRAKVQGQYQRLDENLVQPFGPGVPGQDESWSIGIEVVQDLYTGGRNRASFQGAKLRKQAAIADLESVVNNVLLEVRERFYAVLLARSEINVQEQNVSLLEEELATASNKLAVGAVAPFNVLRAEVALANGQTPLIRARNQYRIATEELRRVVGLPIPPGGELKPAIEAAGEFTFAPRELDITDALARARERRPEFQRLRANIEAQRLSLRAARGSYQPALQAFGGYGWENDRMSDDLSDEFHGWHAGARVSWDLFDGFATRGRVIQAASQLEQARIALAETEQAVEVEVRRAYSSVHEAIELVTATRKVVDQAVESLRLVNSRFDVGAATQLEVLDARVALLVARQNDVQALHDYNVSRARLHRAMGTIADLDTE